MHAIQSWALTVLLHFHILKNVFFFASLRNYDEVGNIMSPGPGGPETDYSNSEIVLELTIGTKLQNRNPQMPSSDAIALSTIFVQ